MAVAKPSRWLLLGLAGALLLAFPACKKPAPKKGLKPVLLITLDTTRADKLGCYGDKRSLTPSLDAFASRSTVFLNCQAPLPQTVPSHVTIMSGWNPARHGVRKNMEVKLPGSVPVIAEEMKAAGYETGAFLSSYVLLEDSGLGRGFGSYDTSFYAPGKGGSLERVAGETLAKASGWLKAQKNPWFCWIHLYDPHWPYAPPAPFKEKHAGAPYDGEVAYMDACLGEFFSGMESTLAASGATVIICGDHGEGLGDHGEMLHGIFLYESTSRVPMIVRMQGQASGQSIEEDVGLVDVAPTIREICKLPKKEGDGISLLPALTGQAFDRSPVFLESVDPFLNFGWSPLFAAVDKRSKCITAPKMELYDLPADAAETKNVFDEKKGPGKDLALATRSYFGSVTPPATEQMAADEEQFQNLQSLGYISGQGGVVVNPSMKGLPDPKDKTDVMDLLWRAGRLLDVGKRADAEPLLRTTVEKDPSNPFAQFTLAAMVVEQKDPAEACRMYEKVLQIRPDHERACGRLMNLLVSSGKNSEAFAIGQTFLKKTFDFTGDVSVLTAWAAYLSGRPEAEVLPYLEKGKTRAAESSKSLQLRALMAMRNGDISKALDYLEAMAEVTPAPVIATLGNDSFFTRLRGEPRFQQIVARAREEAQKRYGQAGPAPAPMP